MQKQNQTKKKLGSIKNVLIYSSQHLQCVVIMSHRYKATINTSYFESTRLLNKFIAARLIPPNF